MIIAVLWDRDRLVKALLAIRKDDPVPGPQKEVAAATKELINKLVAGEIKTNTLVPGVQTGAKIRIFRTEACITLIISGSGGHSTPEIFGQSLLSTERDRGIFQCEWNNRISWQKCHFADRFLNRVLTRERG